MSNLAADLYGSGHPALDRVRHATAVAGNLLWTLSQRPGRGACEVAIAQVGAVSGELLAAARQFGLGEPLAWRLLELRDGVESHAVAASAVAGTAERPQVVLRLLGRGLAVVTAGLADID